MFKSLLFWLCVFLTAIVFFGVVEIFGKGYPEGNKTLKLNDEFQVTVPEKAPDFLYWDGHVLGSKKYPSGSVVVVIETGNPDQHVWATALWVKIKDKVSCVSMMVTYFPIGGFNKNKPIEDQMKTEFYEDVQFFKTWNASGILTKVEQPTSWEVLHQYLSRIEI